MSATACKASPELLAFVKKMPAPDPQLMRGYETGEIFTRSAANHHNKSNRQHHGLFKRPQRERTPDRARMLYRRRMLAATWSMPPKMAGHLTTSQVAYARIVADEVASCGACQLTLDEIADRTGVCRKTAKRAQDRLKELGWITIEERPVKGRKHLSNVVRVVSTEWKLWIDNGPKRRRIGGHSCTTIENQFIPSMEIVPVERSQAAYEGVPGAEPVPPNERRRNQHG